MAKINARSSLSSVSQRVFQPEMIPFNVISLFSAK